MANKFNILGGKRLTVEPEEQPINFENLITVVKKDPQFRAELKKLALKTGVAGNIHDIDTVFDPNLGGGATGNPTNPAPVEPAEPATNFEIDTRLQLLISTIPIAEPGAVIRSEYHNALRDAVRGLASRIGLSVNPTAEFRILTFAPNFLPMQAKTAEAPNLTWNVTLERAATPAISAAELGRTVAGGLVVQLPDGATIYQMIVRGARAAGAPNPKGFRVALNRKKLAPGGAAQTLVSMDLTDVKEGAFEEKDTVQLSDDELAAFDDDESTTGITVSKRKAVSNEKWVYFVTAEFLASDDTAAGKFEIDSVQIYCIV
ncbi:MAG TPA: hypothetical protein VIL74_13535 [Pyrinomonadaceae bacterium]